MSSAAVDPRTGDVVEHTRIPLRAGVPFDELTALVADAAGRIRSTRWGVAIPGPFDYARGIGGHHPGGKLACLAGRDLRTAWAPILGETTWLNDADAFGVGCHASLGRPERLLGLTLGSGIGSAFVVDGLPVAEGPCVPPHGEVHDLPHDGGTIEGQLGPAAIAARLGAPDLGTLCRRARRDPATLGALRTAMGDLARALASATTGFAPSVVAVGGSPTRSWDLFGDAFATGLGGVRVVPLTDTEQVALAGAALYAAR
ncbi:ROK family protein [Mariniluteicoccus endophyticus]